MTGQSIIPGRASGPVLDAAEGLSFWGGVNPLTGIVIVDAATLGLNLVADEAHFIA